MENELLVVLVLAVSTSLAHIRLVEQSGDPIPMSNVTLCFADSYNIKCPKGMLFAPITNTFGLKQPNVTENCTSADQTPYPRQCCEAGLADCTFTSVKDFTNLIDTCSGRTLCKGQRAGRAPVWSNKPKMDQDCPFQSQFINPTSTQYVTTKYACIDTPPVTFCSDKTVSGKGLFIQSANYPGHTTPERTGFQCSCDVKVENGESLVVAALDLRLCNDSRDCSQKLTIDNSTVSTTNVKESIMDFPSYGFSGLKELYCKNHTGDGIAMTLSNVDSKDPLYAWIYLYAHGNDMKLTCNAEISITTTTTTTSTTTTTTTTIPTTTHNLTTDTNKPGTQPSTIVPTETNKPNTKPPTQTEEPTTLSPPAADTRSPGGHSAVCQMTDTEKKLYYIEIAGSALGGVLVTSLVWCIHSRRMRQRRKRRQKQQDRHQSGVPMRQVPVRQSYEPYVSPHDSASQVGYPPQRYRPAPRQHKAQRSPDRQLREETLSEVSENAMDEIISNIAKLLTGMPDMESRLRVFADGAEDMDITEVLKQFPLSQLKATLADLEQKVFVEAL